MTSMPTALGGTHYNPARTILGAIAFGALLAGSATPVTAQAFDPGDEACTGKPEGTACWMGIANHPQCYLWNPSLGLGASATWSAECADGRAQGMGTITWTFGGDKLQVSVGRLEGGRQAGRWTILGAEDSSGEGLYYYAGAFVDGREYGRWILRFFDGQTDEGPYVDGHRQGRWVIRFASGRTGEGPFVDDARHGQWVFRDSDGNTCAAEYVRGELQGECK